ncbi:MAG: hypothetical protein ACLRSW_17745 [Christensenellaceae bacterium]
MLKSIVAASGIWGGHCGGNGCSAGTLTCARSQRSRKVYTGYDTI